jgi:hypothetical protein
MIKILFIAYYFPPIGGGGVQRSLKFCKYLPDFGFSPLVLTAGGTQNDRWAPKDEELTRQLSAGVSVKRIFGIPPRGGGVRFRRKLEELFGVESQFSKKWISSLISEGSRICESEKPSVIYVSMSPFEGAKAAATLSKRYRIPWVADLRDPWALDEMQVYLSAAHRRLAKQKMSRWLQSASAVIMNTPEAAKRLCSEFPEYSRKRVISITNGFDREDFAGRRYEKTEKFTITHTGSLHTEHGLRWRSRRKLAEKFGRIQPGVDFLTRSHFFLLQAVERFVEK